MAAGATYEPIATQTLASAAASITFSSIPASWTDLRLVFTGTNNSASQYISIQLNADTATNYSQTGFYGNGASATSYRANTQSSILGIWAQPISTSIPVMITFDLFSYAGSTNKTILMTGSADQNGSGSSEIAVGLWRSTSAITSIKLFPATGNFNSATTATLYGIKAA